jgi:hypothetical protein
MFRIANELDTTIADLLGEEVAAHPLTEALSAIEESSLKKFAEEEDLPEADIQMLARIAYRGKRPETVEDWRYIYESIKRTLR